MLTSVGVLLLLCVVLAAASSRTERVWPLSGTTSVDLGQSNPFGPRLLAAQNYRYDFHRGNDIPTPALTPLYAIDDGKIRIAGDHPGYKDPIVQIKHSNWDENPNIKFYSNYMHIHNATVVKDQLVTKGQLVGYSNQSASGFEHLHFEIRVGGLNQKHCCNAWKFLPNAANSYTSFTADVTLTPNPDSANCKANVTVAVPPDQLTFNRIELYVDADGQTSVYTYDMCEDNYDHSFSEMDDPYFEDFLIISPTKFNRFSYGKGESKIIDFQFYGLPSGTNVQVKANATDVFGNSVVTSQVPLDCPI